MLDNFEKEYRIYEAKLLAPLDVEEETDEEYDDRITDAAESCLEERMLQPLKNLIINLKNTGGNYAR